MIDFKKNENRFFALVGALIALGILILAIYSPKANEDTEKTTGIIKSVSLANGHLVVVNDESTEVSVSVMPGTVIRDNGPIALTLPDLAPGMGVEVHGYPVDEKTVSAKSINVVVAPAIVLTAPVNGELVPIPVAISGRARVFEGTVQLRVRDEDGRILGKSFTTVQTGAEAFLYGTFSTTLSYDAPSTTKKGKIEAFEISAEDGSEINLVSVPVTFIDTETTAVDLYFSSRVEDPNALDCGRVYPVSRAVVKNDKPIEEALKGLLIGPTEPEGVSGYFSNIPKNVRILSITTKKGVVTADFSKELNEGGGSCLVTAARAQIERTVRQFPGIKTVKITIEGEENDVLQP